MQRYRERISEFVTKTQFRYVNENHLMFKEIPWQFLIKSFIFCTSKLSNNGRFLYQYNEDNFIIKFFVSKKVNLTRLTSKHSGR